MRQDQTGDPTALRPGQLRVRDIWALGVGLVVCGQFFGWNNGLAKHGPTALLIASLFVGLMFLAWALCLSELAVAMPRAGGPLDYGLRAGGEWLGFLMGWSMCLECLFGGVATALAVGSYLEPFLNADPAWRKTIVAGASLSVVGIFHWLQSRGVREQSSWLNGMTLAAVGGLVIFWIACLGNFSAERLMSHPLLPAEQGWAAVLHAVPFALWWFIIIEAAALAAEETENPTRTLPRGLTWAILTVILMVVLTLVIATAAAPFDVFADAENAAFPLKEVFRFTPAGQFFAIRMTFDFLALFGLLASYHGLLFGAGRQLFALGRAGLIPKSLGRLNETLGSPGRALKISSLLIGLLVVMISWVGDAISSAVLVAGFAALTLYLLTTGSLLWLRIREATLLKNYRAPLGMLLPLSVMLMAVIGLFVFPAIDEKGIVLPVALGSYLTGIALFVLCRGRRGITTVSTPAEPGLAVGMKSRNTPWLRSIAAISLGMAMLAFLLLTVSAMGGPEWLGEPSDRSVLLMLAVIAFAIVSVAGYELSRSEGLNDAG